MTSSSEVRLGQEAYANGEFQKALLHFSNDMKYSSKRSPSDQITLLDLRCGTHVKLTQFEAALRDAKQMIRIDRTDARGYCRAASIEKMQSSWSASIKWLQHGLSHVSRTHNLYSHLESQLAKTQDLLTQSLVLQKAADPIAMLPLELLELVLSHLDYNHIVTMLRVSRSWKKVLSKMQPLLSTLDLRVSQKPVTSQMLYAALGRCTLPKTVLVSNIAPLASPMMAKRIDYWTRLNTTIDRLSINDASIRLMPTQYEKLHLKELTLDLKTGIGITNVFKILSLCQSLRHAVFRRIEGESTEILTPNATLERLELGNPYDLAAFHIPPNCFANYPNLRCLTVNGAACSFRASWDLRENGRLQKLDTFASLIRSINLPSSLEQWLWDGTEVRCISPQIAHEAPEGGLPNMHTICLSGDNTRGVLSLLRASGQMELKRVGLHQRQNVQILSDSDSFHLLHSVVELSFESESLRDDDQSHFAQQFPHLETLQLAAPRITGVFILDLLRRPDNKIKKLVLKDCRNVSLDTVEWVRAQGCEIEFHKAKIEVRGGRRLREGWF